MPYLVNIKGIGIPYSSSPTALAPAWDFLKKCADGCRLICTYRANPALWIISDNNKFKPKNNDVAKMFKTCGWMAILNLSICTARGFYSPKQQNDPNYHKQIIWGCDLPPDAKCPTWWELEDDWVPGRWIDLVAGVDHTVPPDLWDREDDEDAPEDECMEDDAPEDVTRTAGVSQRRKKAKNA